MRYLGISFIGLAVVLVVVCVCSYIQAMQVQQKYSSMLSRTYERQELVNDLLRNKERARSMLRTYALVQGAAARDSIEQQLLAVQQADKQAIAKLDKLVHTNSARALLRHIAKDQADYFRQADSVQALIDLHQLQAAQDYKTRVLAPNYILYQNRVIHLNEAITTSLKKEAGGFIAEYSFLRNGYALVLLFGLAAAVSAALILKKIFRRLHQENSLIRVEMQERKQLQNALLESQQRFRSLFNNNPVPMWVYDQQTLRFLEVNEAAMQEYGYTREEFMQLTLFDIRPAEERNALQHLLQVRHKTEERGPLEYTHRRKDGTSFLVELQSHALPPQGAHIPRLVVALNIHEREQAIEKLRRSEQQLREVSSSIPGAVYQLQISADRTISFPFVSEGSYKLLGIPAAAAYTHPKDVFSQLHPDDRKELNATLMQSYQELTPWIHEFRIWHADKQKYVWIRGHSLPSVQKNGTVSWNGTLINITEQKEAQEQLLRSEANLRALLNSSPQAIFLLDKDLRVLTFNAVAAADVKRYLLRTLTQDSNLLDLIDPSLVAQVRENHSKALQGQEVMYETGSGNHWHEVVFKPVLGSDNSILAVALTLLDISEKRRAVEIIKSSQLQLARAQQLAHLGHWEYDLQKETLAWSDSVYSIFRVKKETFSPSIPNLLQFIPDSERTQVTTQIMQSLQNKTGIALEHKVVLADGAERFLYQIGEVVTDEDGTPVKLSGAVQDITERVWAAREVTVAKNLLQSTLENIPEIIFSTDARLAITYISPQCREITGYAEEELLHQNASWLDTLQLENKEDMLHTLLPNLKQGLRQQHAIRIRTKAGQVRWLELRLSPMLDESGNLLRIDGSATDITLFKAEEAQRNELTEQLIKQNQNLQQFTYIVSHNLRAPIANILGLTSIYNYAQPNALMNRRVVDNLAKSAQLLDTTIRDLNEILTVRSQLQQVVEEVSLEQVLKAVLESMPQEKNDAIITYNFEAAPKVLAIRSYVQSIITNLITNAFKYKSPHRKLHLTLSTSQFPDYICLSVSDNGLGLDLATIKDKLFGLYKRFHPQIEGKGLGLHLVKTQAELLNGKVEVESQVGIGTTFNIYFRR